MYFYQNKILLQMMGVIKVADSEKKSLKIHKYTTYQPGPFGQYVKAEVMTKRTRLLSYLLYGLCHYGPEPAISRSADNFKIHVTTLMSSTRKLGDTGQRIPFLTAVN